MNPKKKIKIKWGDRWSIIGATGSGKTVLCKFLLSSLYKANQNRHPIYILDSKLAGDFDEFGREGVGKVYKQQEPPPIHDPKNGAFCIWQPFRDSVENYDAWLQQIYENREPCIVYFDELSSISSSSGKKFPEYYDVLLKQGRGLHMGLISVTQSPAYVPQNLIRQTSHLVRMRLNDEYDTKKLRGLMGAKAEDEPKDQYGFYYKDCTKPRLTSPTTYYDDLTEFFGL